MFAASLAVISSLAATILNQGTSQWEAVTLTRNVVIGIDRASIVKIDDVVTFNNIHAWLEYESAAYATSTVKLNCSELNFQIGARISYDSEGTQIGEFPEELSLMPVEPGSTMSEVAAAVCDDIWPSAFTSPTGLGFYQRSMSELSRNR
jgi:hypothetical protein